MAESTPAEKFKKAVEAKKNLPEEPEVTLWTGKYSAKAMYGSFLVAGLLSIAVILVMILVPAVRENRFWIWSGVWLLALIWLYMAALLAYRKLARHYELTTQRLKHRDGLFFRTGNRVEMIEITDVSYHQGPIEQLLNVGLIRVKSTDQSHPELYLPGISNVRYVADLIDDTRRKERHRRGLHIANV